MQGLKQFDETSEEEEEEEVGASEEMKFLEIIGTNDLDLRRATCGRNEIEAFLMAEFGDYSRILGLWVFCTKPFQNPLNRLLVRARL